MKMSKLRADNGFTIVELMISLSILSVILVTASALMVRIGNTYTKGVNSANLQNANRSVISDVTAALQFSGDAPSGCAAGGDIGTTCYTSTLAGSTPTIYAYCIGTARYSYILNRESGTTEAPGFAAVPHVLWRDTMQNAASCTPVDISVDTPVENPLQTVPDSGYDMVPDHMRLGRFRITESSPGSGSYSIDAWMAYGDSDLVIEDASGRATCRGTMGSQFCAASSLSTSVIRRVNKTD